jgi:hypothetical protein
LATSDEVVHQFRGELFSPTMFCDWQTSPKRIDDVAVGKGRRFRIRRAKGEPERAQREARKVQEAMK